MFDLLKPGFTQVHFGEGAEGGRGFAKGGKASGKDDDAGKSPGGNRGSNAGKSSGGGKSPGGNRGSNAGKSSGGGKSPGGNRGSNAGKSFGGGGGEDRSTRPSTAGSAAAKETRTRTTGTAAFGGRDAGDPRRGQFATPADVDTAATAAQPVPATIAQPRLSFDTALSAPPPTTSTLRATGGFAVNPELSFDGALTFDEALDRTMSALGGGPRVATPTSPGSLVTSPGFRGAFPGATLATPPTGTPTSAPAGITSALPRPGGISASPALRAAYPGINFGPYPTGSSAAAPASPSTTAPPRPTSPGPATELTFRDIIRSAGQGIVNALRTPAAVAGRMNPLTAGISTALAPTQAGIGTLSDVQRIDPTFAPGIDPEFRPEFGPPVPDDFTAVTTTPRMGSPSVPSADLAAPTAEMGVPAMAAPGAPFTPTAGTAPSFDRLSAAPGPTRDMFLDEDGNLTQEAIDRFNIPTAIPGDPATAADLERIEAVVGPAPVTTSAAPAPAAPVRVPVPAGMGGPQPQMTADQVRPSQPPQVSGRPAARPGSVVVPTRDPDTGARSTAEISFQDYAALPRDPEGLVMITSPEAEARNINFLPPSDYGTEQGYALEDLLYFGEDNMRERMAQDPGFVERMLRQTLPGQVIGPLSDREQQIVYNQLVEGPNYRGTPFEETGLFEGNLLGSMMGRVFGDQSFDPNAAEYTAVVENGDIVGSLALDAEGNPIGYRGRSVVDPELLDPNVDIDAARDVMPIYDPTAGGDGGEDEQPEEEFVDPCPEGYVYDSQTGTCVIDPTAVVQQEAAQPVATPQPVVTEVAGAYTPVAGLGSVGLMPGAAPNFNIPRAPVAPITVAPQAGLASLRV